MEEHEKMGGILGDITHAVHDHEERKVDEGFDMGYEKAKRENHAELEDLRSQVEHLRARKEELKAEVDHAREEGRISAKEEARAEFNEFVHDLKERLHSVWSLVKDKFGD